MYEGIKYYKQAIAMAPNFAQAHAALARAYGVLLNLGVETVEEMIPKVKAETQKALAIDEDIADGHLALANRRLYYEWDWTGAEREYKKAITLNPKDALVRWNYSLFLTVMGRNNEAIAQGKKAVELDPVSPEMSNGLSIVYRTLGQYYAMIKQAQKTLKLDHNYLIGYLSLGDAYIGKGMYGEAIAAFEHDLDVTKNYKRFQTGRAVAYALLGETRKAREILSELLEKSQGGYSVRCDIAQVYLSLGEIDPALEWLNKAYDEKDALLVTIRTWPFWDPIRDDPRFQDLLRRMNFPKP